MGGQSVEVGVEVCLGVAPVERAGGGVVSGLEGKQPVFESGEVSEVGGLDDLALHDGEVDLDLVQPGRVDREVDEYGGGQASRIRSTDAWPAWEDPLSTTQNTLRAEA